MPFAEFTLSTFTSLSVNSANVLRVNYRLEMTEIGNKSALP